MVPFDPPLTRSGVARLFRGGDFLTHQTKIPASEDAGYSAETENLAMELKIFFLQQLERESATNRKVLERVPQGKNSWKPHERSMEMGYLAALVASMPGWISMMIETDELNLDKPESQRFRAKAQGSTADLLKLADGSKGQAAAALGGTNEGQLGKPWKFVMGGKALNEAPRSQQIADVFTHMAHHRGQLSVYLRLNEAKVPSIYGPSADERPF
jgi:uncharacterized damage-inducible protein DinB